MTITPQTGTVYLVGAGPGEPDLLTIKAKKVLEQADVIIYDRLIPPALLSYAKPECECIYVGKSPGKHYRTQEEINQLLVQKAQVAQRVVRLKGGDPFVFGRGGEEALALARQEISFEVVPGVSSAVAVPAAAGIPVTHRGLASSFTVVTGHEDPTKESNDIAWDHLSRVGGTLVFLMGIQNLASITEQLISNGMSAETPAAVIEKGTSSQQRTLTGTLATIADAAMQHAVANPSVIVVGQVVNLRNELAWFETRPLFGKHILVTRARHQASKLSAALIALGACVSEMPVLAFAPPTKPEELSKAVQTLASYSWLLCTSANGVQALLAELFAQDLDVRALAGLKLVAIGPATKEAFEQAGLRGIIMPKQHYAEGIAEELEGQVKLGDRVLLVRAEEARDFLPKFLTEQGAKVQEVAAYKTITAEVDRDALIQALSVGAFDAITFTSSSTVHRLIDILAEDAYLLDTVKRYSIGPITSETLRSYGLEPTVQAKHFYIEGLVHAIVEHACKNAFDGQKQ